MFLEANLNLSKCQFIMGLVCFLYIFTMLVMQRGYKKKEKANPICISFIIPQHCKGLLVSLKMGFPEIFSSLSLLTSV